MTVILIINLLFKFFLQELNLKLCKCDELDSLIRGLLFTVASNNNECYFWSQCTEDEQCSTQEYTFQYNKYPFIVCIINNKNNVYILFRYWKSILILLSVFCRL